MNSKMVRVEPEVNPFAFAPPDAGSHRALATLNLTKTHFFTALLWIVFLTLVLLFSLGTLTETWCVFFEWAFKSLHLPGEVTRRAYHFLDFTWQLPRINLKATEPSPAAFWLSMFFTSILFGASFSISQTSMHLRTFVHVLCGLQFSSLLFFLLFPKEFPYSLPGTFSSLLVNSIVFLFGLPWLIGLTYSIFFRGITRTVLFSLILMLYFAVEIPVQCLWWVIVLHYGSLLYLPLLFFCFGISLQIFAFIGLYSWAMSYD